MKAETFRVARQLIDDFPRSSDPLGLMGTVYRQYGDTAEAVTWWRKCLERNPRRADVYNGLAMVALSKGEHENAVELWRKALQMDPSLPGVHGRCASALLTLGKPEEAVATLETGIKIFPEDGENHYLLGQACLQMKQHAKAAGAYQKALELMPDDSRACYGLALACSRLGQEDKAKGYMDRFRKMREAEESASSGRRKAQPDRRWAAQVLADTLANAGRVYRAHGRWPKAEEHWRRAATLDPENTACRQDLVDLLLQARRGREAVEFCQQLRTINPRNATYHLNTGVLFALLGQHDAAEEAIRQGIALAPTRASGLRSLAQVLLRRNEKQGEAKAIAQKLVAVEPAAQNYALLAEACYRNGDLADARAALDQAAKLSRWDPEYLRVRDLIEERK